MNKQEHNRLRADLFRHLDGIVTAPVAYALSQSGLLEVILEEQSITLSNLSKNANEGYLNVALRVLASQGWLDYAILNEDEVKISTNTISPIAFGLFNLYEDVVELMKYSTKFHPRKFEKKPFLVLQKIFRKFQNRYGLEISEEEIVEQLNLQVLKHIEGMIVGPTIVALGMGGMFHKYFMEASFKPEEFHQDPQSFEQLLDIFVYLEWFIKKNGNYSFTDKGLFYAKRASAYGVTVSYIPTFAKINDLLFGDPKVLWNLPKGSKEIHVDREMNVWGSGGAHSNYFRKIDDIIIDIFNLPIEEQPKGIVDMGCGNGAFLIHIFDVIEHRTVRGTILEEFPLFLVGADFNETALKVTRANLVQADIWAKVIWGDIGRPDRLNESLLENYNIRLQDLLNVRTFLDHNRIWKPPQTRNSIEKSQSTGAFAFRGKRIPNKEVEDNLKEHLLKWTPYLQKFGLLIIELHTIPPKTTAENLGKTAATAYDATHGFSDQYIVEIDILHQVASECGLYPVAEYFTKFPNSELATVSINLFKSKQEPQV